MIGTRSESYPYLALSRRLGVSYGAVLRLVDEFEKSVSNVDCYFLLTDDASLTSEQKCDVHNEYVMELERRRRRA